MSAQVLPIFGLASAYTALRANGYADPPSDPAALDDDDRHWRAQFVDLERQILSEPATYGETFIVKLAVWADLIGRPGCIDPVAHQGLFDLLIDEARALLAQGGAA